MDGEALVLEGEWGSMERRSWAGEDRVRGPPVVRMKAKEDGKGQLCRSFRTAGRLSSEEPLKDISMAGRSPLAAVVF